MPDCVGFYSVPNTNNKASFATEFCHIGPALGHPHRLEHSKLPLHAKLSAISVILTMCPLMHHQRPSIDSVHQTNLHSLSDTENNALLALSSSSSSASRTLCERARGLRHT
eukprot:5440859-Amphidinium_carterae.1